MYQLDFVDFSDSIGMRILVTGYVLRSKPMTAVMLTYVVTVPAQIVDSLSSDDVTVREGDSVSLVCHVTGVPQPEVRWRRKQTMSLESTELLSSSAVVDKSLIAGHGEYSSCELSEGSTRYVMYAG